GVGSGRLCSAGIAWAPAVLGSGHLDIIVTQTHRFLTIINLVSDVSVGVDREIELLIVEPGIKTEIGFWLIGASKNPVLVVNQTVVVRIGENQIARTGSGYVGRCINLALILENTDGIVQ